MTVEKKTTYTLSTGEKIMKVGIIGAGFVGESLGKALLKAGHEIMFSSRDPHSEHAQKVHTETGAPVGTISEVLAYSTITAISIPANAIEAMIHENPDHWQNRVILDMNNGFTMAGNSLAEAIAMWTGGRVVKVFNTIGAEHYQNPLFEGQKATMFIAGNDAEAKQIATQLADSIGFNVIDAGGIEIAGLLEKVAQLWVHLAMRRGLGREIAFKLLKRE